jgi:hypothetical protein
MSFGSLVEFSRAPTQVLDKFMSAFKVLDYAVLWKWDDMGKIPDNKPRNVYMSNWFPQRQLLGENFEILMCLELLRARIESIETLQLRH